jgi:adenylate cyclase
MAMQDALFEYNRSAPREQQIHIRVAASLGEVRVTRNDVFGEPVNITSRIEGITPPDEIYLSEAMYMAMNKAEVPSQEVGWRELKGVSGAIRIFNIPRFSTPRLVPQDVMAAEDMSDLVYPYGGAHLAAPAAEGGMLGRFNAGAGIGKGAIRAMVAVLVLVPTTILAVHYGPALMTRFAASTPAVSAKPEPAAVTPPAVRESKPAPVAVARTDRKPAAPPAAPAAKQYQPEFNLNKSSAAQKPDVVAGNAAGLAYARISDAKKAYKDKKISKDEYRKIAKLLEKQMDSEIDQAKRDYKADKISKKEYKERVSQIEKQYK